MLILPSADSLTTTRLATVWPAVKLRLEALGRAASAGWTVRWLAAVGAVVVTLRATAATPLAGTPPWPATCTVRVWPAPTAWQPPSQLPVPMRVSSTRAGLTAL